MTTGEVQVDRRALLAFMDEVPDDERGHHTAIASFLGEPLAVALILHHLNRQGGRAECLSLKVTTGQKRGPRLDAWIEHDSGGQVTAYQTEIKMWAGRAIGGLKLDVDADKHHLLQGGYKQWVRIWDTERRTFKAESVEKVLVPMQPSPGSRADCTEPLACFWWVVQPPRENSTQELQPWFTVGTSSLVFPRVHIFSLSTYLRSLGDEVLTLSMPLVTARLGLLQRLLHADRAP